jgi:signal transduction histidine kinase
MGSELPPNILTDKMNEAALTIVSGLSLPRILQRIANITRDIVGAQYTALGVPSADGQMRSFVTAGIDQEIAKHIHHQPEGKGLLGALLENDQAIRLENLHTDPRSAGFCENHPQMTSFLGVPIVGRDHQRLGNLYLCDKLDGSFFTETDEKVVMVFASFAAIAIENANLHNQLQESALHLERDRIAMELHDGVIQLIYAVGMKLEIIRGKTVLNSEEDKRFQSVFDDLNQIIEDLRSYIRDLRSTSGGQTTLQQRLRNLADHFRDFSAVDVVLDVPSDLPDLSETQRHIVLQIVRETLANIARHAEASHVKIVIQASDKKMHVAVHDDGKGFNPETTPDTGHFGLKNLYQRARSLGGNLQIESEPGKGTSVYLVFPLQRKTFE